MSFRNSEDRLGSAQPAGQDPPVTVSEGSDQQRNESLFSFASPTEFVELPSEGKLYPPGHVLHDQAQVEIKYMTAKEEDILTSQALLKKGLAIDRMLQNIIVDKKISVEDLLVCDKNALIVAARVTGFGSAYNTKVTCPVCATANEVSFDLKDLTQIKHLELGDDVIMTENNTFVITVPRTEAKVEFRAMTGRDESAIFNLNNKQKKMKSGATPLTNQLRQMVVSVNDNTKRTYLDSFVKQVPVIDSKFIRTCYANSLPRLELKQDFMCSFCDHQEDMEVPFTSDFFWPQ
jgi:transcription elongation factor Elf1